MKRFLYLIAFLLLSVPVFAQQAVTYGAGQATALGAGQAMVMNGGASCDSCSGSTILTQHMENVNTTLGTPCGCSVNSPVCTLGSNATITTGWSEDGTYSLYVPAASGNNLSCAISDIHAAGAIDMWVYVASIQSGDNNFVAVVDSNNYIKITETVSNNHFVLNYSAGGVLQTASDVFPGGFLANTAYHLHATWSQVVQGSNYLKICLDTSTGTTNCGFGTTALGTWTGPLSASDFGTAGNSNSGTFFIDNAKIYNAWQ